ncbi:hypothetical protein [Actinoplanes awajinensis]|uniref:Uncharacterized protein n=1 Tax=Actinoplanes awajinensis subsp. mycoplanecinus TaxID=135947 RepID=A0A101J806_9ACTN|nr:hypothetical protein [Actinoplanes awajinensis]KUL21928.1 hypothetical protein ADL15_49545 [Actinoplanes awajinensis subsp. mycoplanecinus]
MTTDPITGHPVRVMIGAGTCALGALAVLFAPAALVVLAAGALLLCWHRLRPSAAFAAVGAVAGAVAGTFGTLLVRTEELCCMFGWSEGRGWPYSWLTRGGVADEPDTARQLAIADGWDVYPEHLAADVVLWAYTGFVLFAVIGLGWRIGRERRGGRPSGS